MYYFLAGKELPRSDTVLSLIIRVFKKSASRIKMTWRKEKSEAWNSQKRNLLPSKSCHVTDNIWISALFFPCKTETIAIAMSKERQFTWLLRLTKLETYTFLFSLSVCLFVIYLFIHSVSYFSQTMCIACCCPTCYVFRNKYADIRFISKAVEVLTCANMPGFQRCLLGSHSFLQEQVYCLTVYCSVLILMC